MPRFKRSPARPIRYQKLPDWKRNALRKKAGGTSEAITAKLYQLVNATIWNTVCTTLADEVDPDLRFNRTADTSGIRRFVTALKRLDYFYQQLTVEEEATLTEAFIPVEDQDDPTVDPAAIFGAIEIVAALASNAYDLEHGSGMRGRPRSRNAAAYFSLFRRWQDHQDQAPNLSKKAGILAFFDECTRGLEFHAEAIHVIERKLSPSGSTLLHKTELMFSEVKKQLRSEFITELRKYMINQHKFPLTSVSAEEGDVVTKDQIADADKNHCKSTT